MTDNAVVEMLALYRLDHDLSFEELAAEMRAVGIQILPRALHVILTKRLRTHPRDRTIHKFKRFLATRQPETGASKRRRSTERVVTP